MMKKIMINDCNNDGVDGNDDSTNHNDDDDNNNITENKNGYSHKNNGRDASKQASSYLKNVLRNENLKILEKLCKARTQVRVTPLW